MKIEAALNGFQPPAASAAWAALGGRSFRMEVVMSGKKLPAKGSPRRRRKDSISFIDDHRQVYAGFDRLSGAKRGYLVRVAGRIVAFVAHLTKHSFETAWDIASSYPRWPIVRPKNAIGVYNLSLVSWQGPFIDTPSFLHGLAYLRLKPTRRVASTPEADCFSLDLVRSVNRKPWTDDRCVMFGKYKFADRSQMPAWLRDMQKKNGSPKPTRLPASDTGRALKRAA